jgi:hypothetical protein
MMMSQRILASLAFGAALALAGSGCGETTYGFEPVDTGKDDSAGEPRPKSNSQYIRAIYADVVGRAPESYDFSIVDAQGNPLITFPIDEQQLLLNTLDGVGDPAPLRALIVAGLLDSAEVTIPTKDDVADPEAWIADQFRRLLGREPNSYELAAFVDEWESDPAVGPHTVIRALVGSREYSSF